MRLIDRLARPVETRSSLADVADWFTFNGFQYQLGQWTQTLAQDRETIPPGYESIVAHAHNGNGVVFACAAFRVRVFSQVRFAYQRLRNGRGVELFSTPNLDLLNETLWLLPRLEQDAILSGNGYVYNDGGTLRRLRPDLVDIMLSTSPETAGFEDIRGYVYWPQGRNSSDSVELDREDVAHYAPHPDPMAHFRGMSPVTPVIREIEADTDATKFKASFFTNGATPNMVVTFDGQKTIEQVREFKSLWDEAHQGPSKAFNTAFLGGGADLSVVGSNLEQAAVKSVQGAGETRIAAALGTHPVVIGLSEGLSGSSLNAGNYGQARRAVSDSLFRPNWASAAGALATLVPSIQGTRLWYDESGVQFLQEDRKDDAEILSSHSQAIRTLTDAGYEPASVVQAVVSGDLTQLGHSGLYSVQLQPPMPDQPAQGRNLRLLRDDDGMMIGVEEINDAG